MQYACTYIVQGWLQTEFVGLTGTVAFDENGLRKDYKLGVVEVTRYKPLRRVR